MADFGGNDEQDIKINIDVVGADESASKLDRLADSLESMASPEALAAQTAAQIAAAEKVAAEERRIAEAAAAERKAAREREAAEMARLTAQYDADRAQRATALAAAREAALKRQQEQEALAASVGAAAIQDRLQALKELEASSERVKQVEEENLRLVESRRDALEGLLAKQRLLSEEIRAADEARRGSAAEAGELERILQRQKETELKPYTGDLISPAAIATAEKQLQELQEKIKNLRKPIEDASAAIDSAPRRTRTELSGPGGKVERAEQVRLPSPTGDYSKEDRAARESFIASVRTLIGDKAKQFDTSDPAKLFQQLEELIKKANAVGPGNFSGIQQAEDTASDSNFKVAQLTESLKALQDRQAEVLDRVVAGPPKGAAPKSAEAKEFTDVVAQAGSISKEIAALESALNAERSRGDEARSISKGAKEAFNAKSLGVTADQMPKLLELLSKIRSNLELKEQITAKAPTVWVDESEARRGLPSTKELDDTIRKANDLEAELSRARGRSGEYKTPIRTGDREVTSGPRESDPEGRSNAQLQEAIEKARDRERTSGQFQAGFIDSKAEIDKAVKEAEAAVVIAFRESRRRMAEAIGPMVDSINLDEIFSGLLKDIADRMVEKFKASGKRTEAEVEKFRDQILSTGENPLAAKDSFTKSGQQRRGAPVIRTMPGEPEPEIPMVGAARTALAEIAKGLMKSSPLLRGVSSVQADRDRDQEVEERQARLRVQATAAKRIPAELTNIGRINQSTGADRGLVSDLEAELTVLDGIEEKTEAQLLRFKAIKDQLEEIKNSAVALSASGDILGILAALGVSPDSNIGATGRGVAGISSPFEGSVVSSLFKPRSKYFDESETDPRSEGLGSPMGTMLRVKREKTGGRGIELQTVTAEGEDLLEALETVEQTSIGITAIFAKITDNMRGGKQNDPALLTSLTDQVIGLLSILNEMRDLDVDSSLPAQTQEKFNALKDIVENLLSPGGGVRETMVALSQGALTNKSMNSIIGKSPDERKAISGDLAKYVLTPLLPNLDALTEAVRTLVETPSKKTAGSGQAQIAGVPFGQPGAVGDINTIKGIVDTIATGDGEKIRAVIAEAIARNVFDADKLRSMIPGETGVGVAPRSEELKGLSAVDGKFDLGSADSRLKFADIIAGVPSIMEILGNYPTLASLLIEGENGGSVPLLESLAAEEEEAKAQLAAIAKRIQSFKKAVPMLATPTTLSDITKTIFGYSGSSDQKPLWEKVSPAEFASRLGGSDGNDETPLPTMRPIVDASTLSEEEARTITPESIPPHLQPLYRGRGLGPDGSPLRTATGFGPSVPPEYQLSAEDAMAVAQDVIDFLKSQGLSLATTEISQQPGTSPLGRIAPGSTGEIPSKTIITVIHKGETVADDKAVLTGLTEAIKSIAQIPTVNRGVTIASFPSTDVPVPGMGRDTPPGYSGVTAGVRRPDQTVETYGAIHLAEKMRLRDNGPLVPVPGRASVASHESGHMGIIGGNAESIFQDKDVMLPVHRAIMKAILMMAKEIQEPSGNVSEEMRAKMVSVVSDFFENIKPGALDEAVITGSEEALNLYVGEFIANAAAQMSGHYGGAGRSISFGQSGQFSGETLEFLKQMLGPSGPPSTTQYGFDTGRGGEPRFAEETSGSLFDAYQKNGGLTRRIVRRGDGLGVSSEEPNRGFTVGGAQLENEQSGLLNFAKSDISGKENLAAALTALFEENKDKILQMMMDGTAVWIGMFTQKIKGANGQVIDGTAFDITDLIPEQGAAKQRAMDRGQDSYGSYENNEFVWKDEFQLRQPGEEQPQTMTRNGDGSFSRIPGTLSGQLPVDRKYGYRTKSRREAARTRRAERRAASSAELDQVLEGQVVSVSGGPIGDANIVNFDAYRCQQCGKLTSDREGGVTPNGTDAYCANCWKKVEPFYNETNPKDGYKYDKYDSKRMQGSEFRGMVNRRTEGLDEEGLAELKQSEYEDHLVRYYRGEEGDDIGQMANREERLFADENIAKAVAQSRAYFEREKAKRKKAQESGPIEGTATTVSETPSGRIYGFGAGPEDPASLDFDFSDLVPEEDDGSFEEDSSDTYSPVEEVKPAPKKEKKPRKKKTPLGADPRSTLVTPREAEVAQAEELGVSTEELAIITPEQTERLIKKKQAKDMAENAARDEERLKTAGTRAEAARKKAREMDPRARLETPLEAQIDEAAELGISPDEAVRIDPSVIERKKKRALEDKIAELNAADAARRAKVEQERFAREKAEREAAEAKEKEASDKRIAAEAARAKVAEEEAKAAEAAAPKAAEAPKAVEPTKEEFEAQVAADNAARKERVAARRKAQAAARKAAKAEEAAAAATEQSADASDAVARAETDATASKVEVAQEVAASTERTPIALGAAGVPPTPPTPPRPPAPPAGGGGQQPDDLQRIDAEVNAAIERLGTGSKLPALEAIVAKIAEEVEKMVNARMEEGEKAGISYDRDALKSSIIESNVGGFKDILVYLDGIAAQGEKLRSQGAMPIMGEGATAGTPGAISERIGNASWLPEGLKRQDLIKIAEDFDKLGQEVALLIDMSRQGKLKIQDEIQSAKKGAESSGGAGGEGGPGGGGGNGWGNEGYAAPDLGNVYKGMEHLKQLANIYRELRPQVLHLTGNIDEASTMMQKQQRAAENVTQALGAYMNVNTGIIKSLKTQVGRAATFLFVQQIGREIATVVEHLQSGVFKFNQVLENTTVGFNTLFANTLQAATSAENELVPAYNAVGVQIGFMKEQALTFNEALALTTNAADKMVARIRDIANVTPFRFQPLVEASLKMKAFGFEAREIPDMINSISNAVAALGGNDEKIDRIAYALGQMNSAGRVYQNDMMQLANAGVAGYRMLSEKMLTDLVALKKYAMGELSGLPDYVIEEMKRLQSVIGSTNFVKSFGSIDQMIETLKDPKRAEGLIRNMAKRGFLMGSVAARAITEGMDKQYQGSAERLSKTMTGALSTIADLSQNFMATAFKPLFDSVRDTIVELGQFMLKSQEITVFVDKVAQNMKNFVSSLSGFGPALEKAGEIFINVFVGGFGAALERGSQFGAVFKDIVDKVGSGLSLIGDILSDKVGRGLATAATLGTIFAKAIMANPMIATITLIIVAISGLADAIKKNTFGFGTYLSVFIDAIKGFITIIADALATISKDIATSAISSFIASMAVAIGALMPFLTVLLGTFSLLLKVLTPFAPVLGLILGIFIAFKTATMLWQVATATLAKPISGIVSAWNSASDAVTKYGSAVKLTADRHADLQAEKIAARDYVYGDNGEILKDKNGKPMLNYNRATERINSEGYPDPVTGERATSMVTAGGKIKNALRSVEERFLPKSLQGILTQPREKIFGAMAPDFGGGFTLRHNDSGEGHMSPVFTGQKLQKRFESFQKGGALQAIGMQLSKEGILELPGMQTGQLKAGANKYTSAWGKNFETLVLIEREASYVMSEAFKEVSKMAAAYKKAIDSNDVTGANAVISQFKQSKEGRMILPMIMRAKGDKRKLKEIGDEELGTMLGEFHSGGLKLSKRDMRRIESLPPEVQQLIYGDVAKRVASGNSRFTKDEKEELEKVRARGLSAAALKGGSVGMIQKMAAAMSNFYDVINKKTAQLIKNVPLLNKLQTVNLGGAGTGLSQIQRGDDGEYYYTGKSGNITNRKVSQDVINSRRSMRGGAFGKLAGLGGMLSQGGALLGIGSASSRAAGMPNAVLAGLEMFGMGNILGPDLKQTLSQKSGLFQSLGNGLGSMIGMGLGGMVPIIGPIIGPAIGSMVGELAGNIADSIIRGSEAAVEQQKKRIEANKALGLSEEDAKAAAELQSKIDKSLGLTGEGSGGIPFLVNGVDSLPQSVDKNKLAEQLSRKDILNLYDYDKSGSIDGGTEMTNAISAINSEIAMNLRLGKNVFEKDSAGNYIYTGEDDVANRAKATGMGYVDVPTTASSGIGATAEQYAAYDKLNAAKAAIAAGSIDPNSFAAMFPELPTNANELRKLNLTEITNPTAKDQKGEGMNQVLKLAGFAYDEANKKSTAFDDTQLQQYLTPGSNFESVIKKLQEAQDSGAVLSEASKKLLDYANLLKIQTANSYTDEFGNIRDMYKGGIARLMSYNQKQIEATQQTDAEGKVIANSGKSFTDLLGYRAVEMGTGIGGGDTRYNDLVMATLNQIGRIDPVDAMIEAGVIKSIDEMVGWSAAQLKEALAKTVEYFDAFNKRAQALTPKVDLKKSRRELMDEFGSDLGYKLFDQFFEERKKLSGLEAERKKLGGDSELSRLQMLEDATANKSITRTTNTYEGGRIVATDKTTEALPSILTTAEAAKLARIKAIDKEINTLRYQTFKISVLEDKRTSSSEAIRKKALQDEAALAKFKSDNSDALSKIQTKITQNQSLTRAELALVEREAALRDRIFTTTEREVDLGQTLAILEGQGISISNKELLNNQALLQILARKADLQAIANKSSQSAVYWAQLEAQAKAQGADLAAKQNELSLARLQALQDFNVTSFGDAAVSSQRDAWWAKTTDDQQKAYEAYLSRTATLRNQIKLMETNLNSLSGKLENNPYGFSEAELTKIRQLVAQAQGALVGGDQGASTTAAIQRNTSLLNTMAGVAQKAYERIKKAQQTTHDEYIKQLDEQAKAIDERYKKRTQEQTEKGLLEQLQLAGLAMRSESADPLEAAKSFYEAKNSLAEFYIEKQRDDELKAIEDEKQRYSKQFQENTDAQEQIYSASITRMQNRFEAVSKVLGMDSIPGETLNDLLRLTMTGTLPGMSEAMQKMSTTDIFKKILANAEDVAGMGQQTLALGETMGNLEFGQFAAESGTYDVPASLRNGLSKYNTLSSAGGFNVFRGDTQESGLLATFMNEAISAGLKYTDVGVKDSETGKDKVFTGASAIRTYLKSIMPSGGFGTAEKDKEKAAVLEYAEALLSGKNTFGTTAKMAILAQRTLEQGLTDFETATKTNINMAAMLEADLSDEVINKFIQASGETPTAESVQKLRDMVRDTYADVLARFDLEEYAKFADSTDSRIGALSGTLNSLDDVMSHLSGTLGAAQNNLTTLDKILFGSTYDNTAPIPGIDAATEQLQSVTDAIEATRSAFESTMTNLESYADSLSGPIGAFHQLAVQMSDISQLATQIKTSGIGGVQASVTSYNTVPVNITITNAQDMDAAELAALVEEGVGRALRGSGGSYITSSTNISTT